MPVKLSKQSPDIKEKSFSDAHNDGLPTASIPRPDTSPSQEAPPDGANDYNDASPSQSASDELNAAFFRLSVVPLTIAFPDSHRCLIHLKLLSALHNLKEDVGYTDGLFGLWDARSDYAAEREKTLSQIREKR